MLSYYAEMAAARGLVSMIASNASPWVAPHGATEGRLGTNPICFGFPSADDPIIFDIGTSAIIHAEVTLARRLGNELPENVAFDRDGAADARSRCRARRRFRRMGWPQRIGPRHRRCNFSASWQDRRPFRLNSPASATSWWRCGLI